MIKRTLLFICLFSTIILCFLSPMQAAVVPSRENRPISHSETQLPRQYTAASQTKVAYLTFDDGPNKYTSQILNILKQKNGKATFFIIGGRVSRYPQTTKRVIEEGHYLGLHSMSHNAKSLYNGDPSILVSEMEQAREIVRTITGIDTHLVRVPYGSMPYLKKNYRDALVASHYKMWDWTIDTYDWKSPHNPSAILERVMNQSDKPVEVILMHDSNVTVQILPKIIDYLHSQGYTLLPYNPSSHLEVNFWKDARL
ncbi:polysaccharide deacetylase [Bacillus cereus]